MCTCVSSLNCIFWNMFYLTIIRYPCMWAYNPWKSECSLCFSLNSFIFIGKWLFLRPSFQIWSPNFAFGLHTQKPKWNRCGFQSLWVKVTSHQSQQKLKFNLYKCKCHNTEEVSGWSGLKWHLSNLCVTTAEVAGIQAPLHQSSEQHESLAGWQTEPSFSKPGGCRTGSAAFSCVFTMTARQNPLCISGVNLCFQATL